MHFNAHLSSNAIIEWLSVMKMLKSEIHFFRYSVFRVLVSPATCAKSLYGNLVSFAVFV